MVNNNSVPTQVCLVKGEKELKRKERGCFYGEINKSNNDSNKGPTMRDTNSLVSLYITASFPEAVILLFITNDPLSVPLDKDNEGSGDEIVTLVFIRETERAPNVISLNI